MPLLHPIFPHPHLQVQDGLQTLQKVRDQVFQAWALKQERLQAMLQEQRLLRQCGHLAELLTAQEAGLAAPGPALIFPILFLFPVSLLLPFLLGLWLFWGGGGEMEQKGYG